VIAARISRVAAGWAAAVFVWLAVPAAGFAGQYTVVSCDAAAPTHDGSAWQAQAGSYNVYKLCPSTTGATPTPRGMVTRVVAPGQTFAAGTFSRLWFFAPGGTRITRLDWSGRWARNTPSWAVEIRAQGGPDRRLVGVPAQPGANGWQSGVEDPNVRSYYPPVGTTRLLQNT
jgi:hypothetical protein